jgi:hypothetical protein
MNCIICLDSGEEKLITNKLCSCVYKKHKTCWNNYIKSNTSAVCPLCRKNLSSSAQHSISIPIPSAPVVEPVTGYQTENYTQITYQEFQDIIQSAQVQQATQEQIQQSRQNISNQVVHRKIKAILLGVVLATIIIVILKLVI